MGESGQDNRNNHPVYESKSDYLATLTPEQAGKLDRISAHRAAMGIPDWFCASSPAHAHHWVHSGGRGSWECCYCLEKVNTWPVVDSTNPLHMAAMKRKIAKIREADNTTAQLPDDLTVSREANAEKWKICERHQEAAKDT